MSELQKGVTIRIAGNTQLPCLLALRAKGYRVWLDYHRLGGPEDTNPDYQLHYQAECAGGYFSSTTPEELLGLVAMWEVRGNDWRLKPGEGAIDDELHAASRTFDQDGNELPG
ncbi:hypothetical protein R5W24_006303 [Gemmata sp. JC717]|uniref:hypothetical protein n=1 Tax=Gemmata algarum TaxID=2975278 RepID=UPI0021BBAC4E|nr:hypothetical protein [Gemmata algarum]MDY3557116.1 hypothetical protein [Gemmata algarum]